MEIHTEGFPHQLGSQFTRTTQLLRYLYIVEFGLLVLCSFVPVHEGRFFFFFFCSIFWYYLVHGVARSRTRLSNFAFTFHFPALEKEMATHSSVLAWGIPGTGEPGGLLSMGSHRVRHD